jgi:hypothetical protein
MAAARLFRPRVAAAEEVERSIAQTRAGCPLGVAVAVVAASGQAPSSPAADHREEESEHRSQARSLPEALACRRSLAAAKAPWLARSSAAAWARRWAVPVALAAAVALRSGQTAAPHAAEAAGAGVVAQRDAVAAPQPEEARDAVAAAVGEEVARLDAAAALRPEAAGRAGAAVQQPAAPCVREAARPSAAAWVFRQDRVRRRLAPQPAARFARAMKGWRSAAP